MRKKVLWTLKGHAGEFKQTTGGCRVQLALEGITSNPDGDSHRGELVVSGGRKAKKLCSPWFVSVMHVAASREEGGGAVVSLKMGWWRNDKGQMRQAQ